MAYSIKLDKTVYLDYKLLQNPLKIHCFFLFDSILPPPSPGHDVTGQRKNLGRDWETYVLAYTGLPSSSGGTMLGLPSKLLVPSVNTILGVTHTPVHHRAIYSQCDPGDSE